MPDRVVDQRSPAEPVEDPEHGACWSFQNVSGEPIRVISACSPVRHQRAATRR